ncbi:MAG: hypothetical protein HDR12_14000 [Lachnospiraceae bacterium]|nr:hypothetical protein [Lachnospiraceae bacterium]
MTVKAKQALKKRQAELMQEYHQWEVMQTDFSFDEDFNYFCQWKMQLLDEEAEQIRCVLEMGCVNDRQ